MHSKSRSRHITSLSWETLTYILYREALEACRQSSHRATLGFGGAADLILNEPLSKSHVNVCSHIQAIPNETQFNSFQRYLIWQTDIYILTYHPLVNRQALRTSTDTILDVIHTLVYTSKQKEIVSNIVLKCGPWGLNHVKQLFHFYAGH